MPSDGLSQSARRRGFALTGEAMSALAELIGTDGKGEAGEQEASKISNRGLRMSKPTLPLPNIIRRARTPTSCANVAQCRPNVGAAQKRGIHKRPHSKSTDTVQTGSEKAGPAGDTA